jgi:hypothetical protein
MIAEIARLKELQASEASATYKTEEKEFKYECEMLNAAPVMLEALSLIQPGDAERIRTVLLTLKDPMWASCAEVLGRMRELCLKMEES